MGEIPGKHSLFGFGFLVLQKPRRRFGLVYVMVWYGQQQNQQEEDRIIFSLTPRRNGISLEWIIEMFRNIIGEECLQCNFSWPLVGVIIGVLETLTRLSKWIICGIAHYDDYLHTSTYSSCKITSHPHPWSTFPSLFLRRSEKFDET